MYRIIFIGICFMVLSFQHKLKSDLLGRKTSGWLVFKKNTGVLFAEDSLPNKVRSRDFFNNIQYTNGIDVSYNSSIYTLEKYATPFQVVFWGDSNKEYIKIVPIQAEIFNRKKSFDPKGNAWSFVGAKDTTIILFNSPDSLYVSNICPYKKTTGDCYEAQICSK